MFAFIDGLGLWVEFSAVLVIGICVGRRWARVKMEAQCAARNCDTIKQMRKDKMELAANNMKISRAHEIIRSTAIQQAHRIHRLETSNGIMGKEIQKLTYQIPRPQRRLVA